VNSIPGKAWDAMGGGAGSVSHLKQEMYAPKEGVDLPGIAKEHFKKITIRETGRKVTLSATGRAKIKKVSGFQVKFR